MLTYAIFEMRFFTMSGLVCPTVTYLRSEPMSPGTILRLDRTTHKMITDGERHESTLLYPYTASQSPSSRKSSDEPFFDDEKQKYSVPDSILFTLCNKNVNVCRYPVNSVAANLLPTGLLSCHPVFSPIHGQSLLYSHTGQPRLVCPYLSSLARHDRHSLELVLPLPCTSFSNETAPHERPVPG